MDNIQQEKVDQFKNVTGVATDRARFYLESSGWNVEVLVYTYHDTRLARKIRFSNFLYQKLFAGTSLAMVIMTLRPNKKVCVFPVTCPKKLG